MSKTEVAVVENQLPAHMAFAQEDEGLGLGALGADDQAIPFVKLLQAISKEVKKKSDQYVEGAEPGSILEAVSGKVYDGETGIVVVPVYVEPSWVEWAVGDAAGGYRGKHSNETRLLDETTRGPKGELLLDNGNQLVRTMYFYCLLLHDGGLFDQVVISMARSQLKKAKAWNRQMKSTIVRRPDGTPFVAPSFLFKYRLASTTEASANGEFFNWRIQQEGMLEDERIYRMAREFAASVERGEVKTEPEGDGDRNAGAVSEETIPF